MKPNLKQTSRLRQQSLQQRNPVIKAHINKLQKDIGDKLNFESDINMGKIVQLH